MANDNPFTDFIIKYKDQPVAFVTDILKVTPDPWQAEFLTAIQSGERRISIRSGHGTGKSTAASWAMLWYLLFRYPVKVVVTAPTSGQMFDALFAELKRWVNELPAPLKEILDVKSDRISHKAAPSEAFCVCRVARPETPEALAGIHSSNVLLIADEASAVSQKVFEAAAGSMSGENACTVLLGNPTRSSGFFFDTHHRQADQWWTRRVSCVDSPRVSEDYVKEMAQRYGEDSNQFRVRVLGQFPLTDDDTAISLDLCEAAMSRDVVITENEPILWGLDVARYGSASSVLCKRQGRKVLAITKLASNLDLMQLTGAVVAEFESCQPRNQPQQICVDSIGVGGGVCDRLRELGLPAMGINTSEAPSLRGTYLNLRAELWFKLKGWLETREVSLPKNDTLLAELVAVKYKYTSSGKMQLESKAEMQKRGVASPDHGDALVLTFAVEGITAMHGSSFSSDWSRPIPRNLNMT